MQLMERRATGNVPGEGGAADAFWCTPNAWRVKAAELSPCCCDRCTLRVDLGEVFDRRPSFFEIPVFTTERCVADGATSGKFVGLRWNFRKLVIVWRLSQHKLNCSPNATGRLWWDVYDAKVRQKMPDLKAFTESWSSAKFLPFWQKFNDASRHQPKLLIYTSFWRCLESESHVHRTKIFTFNVRESLTPFNRLCYQAETAVNTLHWLKYRSQSKL